MHIKKNENLLSNRFRTFYPVVIDVETAGFNPITDALLEIAVITLTMNKKGWLKTEKKIHFHIKPFQGSLIKKEALLFNKIDPFNPLRGAVSEKEAFKEIFSIIYKGIKKYDCSKGIIVAHNANFDHNFIMAASQRIQSKNNPFHPFATFDTATLSGLAVGQTVLSKACRAIGLSFDNNQAHSALYDTLQTANLFCKIINRWKKLGGWPIYKRNI
ncbi:MAG: ribonuclease T [Buchnera aphidicola (Periphyllus lyropictus)]|uniref:ribonuclease T n=1 Tax=Buchnera aphidicola TaxID=9 RepID=UPI001EC12897|nr:ribonuclease T [Buchnera aphidicola]NIH16664.1 ribonuclease T [Buchnera aphidicola (Periphyllus lyropictus)]USS94573.1 ribonuclease T [Buchnera aphidicola (Periphyllus lyropictus)]